MSEPRFVRAIQVAKVPEGRGRVVTVGRSELAVFNVEGAFHAIENECPHAGAPLGEGRLEGCVVLCPYHAWRFDVTTGALLKSELTVDRFETRVEEGWVYVSDTPLPNPTPDAS